MVEKKGCIVSLPVPEEIGKKLVVSGYETLEDLHITLARVMYDDNIVTEQQMNNYVFSSLFKLGLPPNYGQISGIKRFYEVQDGTTDALVACVKIDDLYVWREQFLELLSIEGVIVSNNYKFHPHITIAYIDTGKNFDYTLDDEILNMNINFGYTEVRNNNEISIVEIK